MTDLRTRAPWRRPGRERPAVGLFWRAFGAVVVALRFPILLAWIGAAVGATLLLPQLSASGSVTGLIPSSAPALRAEATATRLFGFPLTSQTLVVQRDPQSFPLQTQVAAARTALAYDQGRLPRIPGLIGAVPIANTNGLFPGSRERSTTIITYLYSSPSTSVAAEAAAGQEYARRYASRPQDHLVGVTGPAPAEAAQAGIILHRLPWVEAATLLAIALIVGIYFRAPGAPLACLACAAVTYLVAVRVVAWAAMREGATVPPDLEPILVVLLLGVTTDYTVFFLAGMRTRLAEGQRRVAAARRTTAEFAPIIVTAGLVVAAGIAALAVAQLGPLRVFGPALALTVLIAMLVSVTMAPALIGTFGGALFYPRHLGRRRAGKTAVRKRDAAPEGDTGHGVGNGGRGDGPGPVGEGRDRPGSPRQPGQWHWREAPARVLTTRPVALLVAAVCVVGLAGAASGLRGLRVGYPLVQALPADSRPVRAADAVSRGFAAGILSPTEVIVLGSGVGRQRAALARLQRELAAGPGVAAVVGPTDLPALQSQFHVMVARSGNAARFAVIERSDPLSPSAINRVRALRAGLPSLLSKAGLTGARFEVGGETALTGEAIEATESGLGRIALAIAVVILVLLAAFLGSVVAPFYLLAASVLALASALGLTVYVFQGLLGYPGLVYYVPFVVAVLLVSLGSDYNVFVVGRIWEEARHLPLRDAVARAVPRASRAITTAGFALAAGFALLALVPLDQFREIAVAMVLGIIIDTLVVRSLLVPSLVVLFGRLGKWPQRSGRARPTPASG